MTCRAFSSKSDSAATGILRQAGPRTTFNISELGFFNLSESHSRSVRMSGALPPGPREIITHVHGGHLGEFSLELSDSFKGVHCLLKNTVQP